MTRWVDLSRPVGPGMPVFPGDPGFAAEPAATVAGDGFAVTRLHLGTHTGTHVDAPAHVVPGGPTVEELPLELFSGTALVLDVRGRAVIDAEDVRPAAGARIVLLRTGWDGFAGTGREFDHPFLTAAAARALRAGGTRTTGIDAASVDGPGTLAAHRVLLGTRPDPGVVVENLRGLEGLPVEVEFCAFGWALTGGDGSPVRAVARPAR
ncbi:kynurenine formamidase [Kineococcus radiotolerans]|uniref:Kynurenine formamidase n=1 Tax=Kineococcus radiotolerans TaxID=131568 RepID=A0A7W4XXQ4_KINRA|nr:cyclase family protein [Kineococcus radiotolerans]MBB2902193.1 kynurenine formamidase [Kineococcus radiotolerans]